MSNPFDLTGKVAIVTGSTKGLGRAMAEGLARAGADVVVSSRKQDLCDAVAAEIASATGRTVVERSISLAGRSSARIDGRPATLEDLHALGARHVDIHGQSEQLAILRPGVQLGVLDEFAGLGQRRQLLAATVRELREVRRSLTALATDSRERERLVTQLQFERDEIEAAGLSLGEDEALRNEQARLGSVARLLQDAITAIEALDEPPLAACLRAIAALLGRDSASGFEPLAAAFEDAADDLRRALRVYRDGLEEDPERLEAVSLRLDRIARLRRKYGERLEDVLTYGENAGRRLAELASSEQSVEALSARERELSARIAESALALSLARRATAGALVRAIARELEGLRMGGAMLSVGFACEDDPVGVVVPLPDYEVVITDRDGPDDGEGHARAFSESGVDRVEFLASFNHGESPRPLAAVASGGETSRFLLALTTVLGTAAEPRVVVFDEVDEGVGGRAGSLVGDALARLAGRHQVLCITHLPQVAAFAGRHYVVTKQTDGDRSWSDIREVVGEERVEELAAMLGTVSEATRAAARDLLALGSPAGKQADILD